MRPAPRALTIAAAAAPLCAVSLAGQTLAAADSLLAAGDTSGAIAGYEALVRKDLRNAEAHFRAGVLYMTRHVPGTSLSPARRKAEEHFRYAARFQPDRAKYLLALAELFRTESDVTARVQVAGLVERAREAARRHGGGAMAQVEYRTARIEWERYEQLASRYMLVGDVMQVDVDGMLDDWRRVEEFFDNRSRPVPGDPGGINRSTAEAALRAALSADPRYIDAAGLLVVALGEGHRWSEAHDVARRLVRAAPDSGRAHAILGLALTRLLRWSAARDAFRHSLELMPPAERAPYDNLGMILRAADSTRLAGLPGPQRAAQQSLYWAVSQPLFLGDVNELQIEFYARLTYVLHRWSDPLRGYRGYESDGGAVFVRYGPPDIWATLGRGTVGDGDAVGMLEAGRNTVVWVYRPARLRFVFSLVPGYARAIFGGDSRAFYREARDLRPVRFDNIPVVRSLDTIAAQVAQFRGEPAAATDVAIFATTPIGRMVSTVALADYDLATAAIVKDAAMRDVVRERTDERIRGGDSLQVNRRTWRLSLKPAEYLLRVEAVLPALDRAARSSSLLAVRPFDGDTLQVSDVVVAERVVPRDSAGSRWTDFFIDPSAGRFSPGVPVALLWEIYNLRPDAAGVARYRVEVRFTVKEIERHGFAARVLGGIGDAVGLSARGDDEVALEFAREVAAHPAGRQVEYLSVDLQNAPEATYLVSVTVTDAGTGRTATAEREIRVTRSVLTR